MYINCVDRPIIAGRIDPRKTTSEALLKIDDIFCDFIEPQSYQSIPVLAELASLPYPCFAFALDLDCLIPCESYEEAMHVKFVTI